MCVVIKILSTYWSPENVVGMSTIRRPGQSGVPVPTGQEFISSPKRPDQH